MTEEQKEDFKQGFEIAYQVEDFKGVMEWVFNFIEIEIESKFHQPTVIGRYSWLQKDDLEFAIALQEENRLEAVKWLCEKARGHSLTPLKDAKDILDAYR